MGKLLPVPTHVHKVDNVVTIGGGKTDVNGYSPAKRKDKHHAIGDPHLCFMATHPEVRNYTAPEDPIAADVLPRMSYLVGRDDAPTLKTYTPNDSDAVNLDGTDFDYRNNACTRDRYAERVDDRTRSKILKGNLEHGLRENTSTMGRMSTLILVVTKTGMEGAGDPRNTTALNRATLCSNCGSLT